MDLGRLVFMDEKAKGSLRSLRQLPNKTIAIEKILVMLNPEIILIQLKFILIQIKLMEDLT
ncbi:MAG: hypothetical protein AABW63_00045 [Nanoarchaeota archaeon]